MPRRAAHPVRLGWRTVLGGPRAAFAVATFAGAAALAVRALTVRDSTARYAVVILLIGLCGVAVGMVVQPRHVLVHPVVADDEVSLTADVSCGSKTPATSPHPPWCGACRAPRCSAPRLAGGTPHGWPSSHWAPITLALTTLRTERSSTVAQHVTSAR
ncbi:hypothetical protein [Streptomyces sp. NPDC017529]|uniref:hypothetical protein n=1 Tax=Streptomyces sp. NPDC017529 TaxID=3365000 RepID=UPI0037956C9C